jgi:hypothetical protein
MVLDTELQRNLLLELINSATIPGKGLDIIYELKQNILAASINQETSSAKATRVHNDLAR